MYFLFGKFYKWNLWLCVHNDVSNSFGELCDLCFSNGYMFVMVIDYYFLSPWFTYTNEEQIVLITVMY